jgi:hypothetical protein
MMHFAGWVEALAAPTTPGQKERVDRTAAPRADDVGNQATKEINTPRG